MSAELQSRLKSSTSPPPAVGDGDADDRRREIKKRKPRLQRVPAARTQGRHRRRVALSHSDDSDDPDDPDPPERKNPHRLINRVGLREYGIAYSRVHLRRLMAQGRFPKTVALGRNRVAWVEQEVIAWIESRIAERDAEAA
jgi:prophage regulatory protein